jgi:uncharacterized membrane protein YhhN
VNAAAFALLALGGMFAIADWVAVAEDALRIERIAKPATLVAFIAAAVVLDPADPAVRAWFVVALVLSLAGDVFLLRPHIRFVAGLSAFLLAHVVYSVGFVVDGLEVTRLVVGIVVVLVAAAFVGRRIVTAVRHGPESALAIPVTGYVLVISVMVALAIGTGGAAATAGAVLFYCSDGLIAWNRFTEPLRWAPVAIMVTYHAAQALLILSLT